jgi:hypothetical protein
MSEMFMKEPPSLKELLTGIATLEKKLNGK